MSLAVNSNRVEHAGWPEKRRHFAEVSVLRASAGSLEMMAVSTAIMSVTIVSVTIVSVTIVSVTIVSVRCHH